MTDTQQAQALRAMVAALGVEYGHEASIKVVPGAIWPQRFLLSIYKDDLGPQPWARLMPILQALALPAHLAVLAQAELAQARFVHLGYEQAGTAVTYKLYLEFPPGYHDSGGHDPQLHGWLVHKAFKWRTDAADPGTIARYRGGPGLTRAAVVAHISQCYGVGNDSPAARLPIRLLELAETRMDVSELFLLDVVEEGNSRHSFDLNLYDAELSLADILPLLAPALTGFGISAQQVDGLRRLADQTLGHLSGGLDRAGAEFFTIYFGAGPG